MARTTKAATNENTRGGVSKRAKKDPNCPKRSKSAYMYWLAENRPALSINGRSVVEVAKAAGLIWNTLTEKSKWEKLAAEDKERYEREIAIYKANQQH
uniref:HMG box domain-containing protein n=1 Tax=Rhabditophanes sp. KR3021 TaxID=114890 RepID=A0AC35TJH6_9BILA